MSKYLDFENPKWQKGYKLFQASRESLKKNIGKKICYVTHVDRYRGYIRVEYGTIHSVRYSTLYLNNMENQIDIRDIKECGIEIENTDEAVHP